MTAARAAAKICAECDRAFTVQSAFSWQTVCSKCFFGRESKSAAIARLEDEVEKLEADILRLREMAERLPKRPRPFGQHRWRQVMGLVHPDRHGGSAASNEIASWLLSVRSEFGA